MQNRLPALHADLAEAKAAWWDRPGAKPEIALTLLGATALLGVVVAATQRLPDGALAAPGDVAAALIAVAASACAYLAVARSRRRIVAHLAAHWLRPALSNSVLRRETRVRLALRVLWAASQLAVVMQLVVLHGVLEPRHAAWIAASSGAAILLACAAPSRRAPHGRARRRPRAVRGSAGAAAQHALTRAWPRGYRAWCVLAPVAGLATPVAALVSGQRAWLGTGGWIAVALLVLLALLTRPGAREAHALLSQRGLPAGRCLRPLVLGPLAVGVAVPLPMAAAAAAMGAGGHAAAALALALAWVVFVALRLASDLARATRRRPEPYIVANALVLAVAATLPPLLVLSVPAQLLSYARYVRRHWERTT